MNYCLKIQQDAKYLEQADEIKCSWEYVNQLDEIYKKYRKTIIIDVPRDDKDIDWKNFSNLEKITDNNIIFCLSNLYMCQDCIKNHIPFYYKNAINNFYDANALIKLGVCYLKIAAPLTHSLKEVKKLNIPIRVAANTPYNLNIPRQDGVCGGWIRPEDIELYDEYIQTIEFDNCDVKRESALFRIYHDQKQWNGELQEIINDFNFYGNCHLLDQELIKRRMVCGQNCQKGGYCKICYTMLSLANIVNLKNYIKGNKNEL